MDWIEVTARTVDAAKELALDRLGVVEDELEFEVIDEPRTGFLRRSDARIRARVLPLSREKPSDRRRRGRGDRDRQASSGSGSGRPDSGRDRPPKAQVATQDRAGAGAPTGGNGGEPAGERSTAGGGSRSRRRRGRGGGGGSTTQGSPASHGAEHRYDDKAEAEVDVETVPVDVQAAFAAEFTDGLVRAMGFQATVGTEVGEDDVTVQIEGENLGLLVGPRGVTLQAMEDVVRAALQRRAGGRSARAHVDVGGYRERRREALAAFARNVATEVSDQGVARSLEPMNAADRKVVHDAVAEVDGVVTGSEGEEPRRRVVISPE